MNNKLKVSLKIGFFVFVSSIIFFIIALFWYQDYSSLKVFFHEFFMGDNLILLIVIAFFSIFIGWISGFFIRDIFVSIEEYNNKLKDYNHFLAHELKTPISVISSNLEVLKYGFNESKITHSMNELKKMNNIVEGLLNFSESFNHLEKKEINVENFIKSFTSFKGDITINNNQFNFSIITDEILFERIIINIIDNALKYSLDNKVSIYMSEEKITFINTIFKTLDQEDLNNINNKFYTKTCNENTGVGLGLPMIQEISKVLGYGLNIHSDKNTFIVELLLQQKEID